MLEISERYGIKPGEAAMPEDRKDKLVNLPNDVWDALDKEARRCRRSVTKQIEAIIVSYLRMDDVDLKEMDRPDLEIVGRQARVGEKLERPTYGAVAGKPKKKHTPPK